MEYNKIIWEVTGVHNKFQKLCTIDESHKIRWEKLFEKYILFGASS